MVFQPWPAGTGAYLQGVLKTHGPGAFQRTAMVIPPYDGPMPASEEDLAFLPVHRLAALVAARKVSPVDLTRIYLERLKKYDARLLLAVTILEGPAREAAQQADADIKRGQYRGPLHGIPWGVKDLFAVKGAPTTWGAAEFENRVIDQDAEVVTRLAAAGAVLIAKLATGRFAMGDQWYRGRTNNPWNPQVGSSGSSAGPGAATAAGCVAFAIGTETRGSIVSPAYVNGLCALRPTYGRVPRTGGMVLAWTMDRVGPMTRSAMDAALVFDAIHGVDDHDPTTITAPFHFQPALAAGDLAKLRIGYDRSAPQAFLDRLRELGANPVPMPARPRVNLNSLDAESTEAFSGDLATGVLQDVDAPNGGRGSGRFTAGRTTGAVDFLNTQRHRWKLCADMAAVFKDFDLYVCNTDLGDCTLTSLTGHPAVVLPYAFSATPGRGNAAPTPAQPQCTTLVGNLYADDLILSVAHAFQEKTDFHTRRPKLEG
jgi:Asp-tRNA(Asn)/Glu-tRNA(Gln) amidotransferase A subunit family amidase